MTLQFQEEAWQGLAALDDPLARMLAMLESSRTGRERASP